MEAGEVLAFYQPIICLKTQSLVGFEALARWRRPGVGVLAPPDFLAMADDIDQLGKLSSNIRSNAVDDLSAWRRTAPQAQQLVEDRAAQVRTEGTMSTLPAATR